MVYFVQLNGKMNNKPLVSIIIPVHNGEKWINDCFESILKQDILDCSLIEISVYNDASSDKTKNILEGWQAKVLNIPNLKMIVTHSSNSQPCGVGFAKNRAIEQSTGMFLCFQDVDDIMMPTRISKQLLEAKKYPHAIVGCQVLRIPENSTPRLTAWANHIPQELLNVQIYTSHGPTVLMPTWFLSKKTFEKVGLFSEEGKGTPEDLLFFYSHLDGGGTVRRVDEILLQYRYHPDCTSFSVSEETIWKIRLEHLERRVLSQWTSLTIWNAGKQGKRFYRSLKPANRRKVIQFCDVDPNKTGTFYEPYPRPLSKEDPKRIPIVHFSVVKPPLITCVKLDMTQGRFEDNLKSLNLVEGRDFYVFS